MRLTQKQEWLVARYLRDVAGQLGDASDAVREHALYRARSYIYRRLSERQSADTPLQDGDVLAVLRELGDPSNTARSWVRNVRTPGGLALSSENRKWLGVCGGLAEYLGMDAAWVRLAFVLLGVTGPIIVAIYLGLYFDMYLNSDPEGIPRIDKARAIQSPLFCVAAAGALHLIARLLLYAIPVAYERYAGMGRLSDLGGWDWLRTHATVLLFCVLSGALPFALLSALPLSNQWDHSLKRVAQAILALYAVTLAFGIACFLVGMILHVVREFSV